VQSFLSREQIEQAIRILPQVGWVRLRKVAAAYCRGRPFDADDLLQRAFTKALDASRQCPADIDVVRFLADTMHSIASDDAKKRRRHPELQAVSLFGDDGGLALDPPDCRATAEQALAGDQQAARFKQAIIGLFADDPVAQVMVEGIMEGMEGEELREVTGLTKIAFASKRRLIRRRVEKAFPDGWSP
jgi:DNA-directed RNA polymerase specialized sigma24 family protein